ncbi:hypothetical protein DCS_02781 [Drechmeria coniospora]|uniref:Alpha-galactosidase A n=1 Tax=Drechmeria coniospora TaxID=98403 RepID=A0A151GX11_DRECN|nr:hypothetical protein DCS_02781 [Drechmeria coniospora]KYK61638.1 hypothetical protein DCS_02781 [Drechmeria coniospora]ODA82433.1 hypothetical protein RJ55_00940 [Drechmeria coniospora]
MAASTRNSNVQLLATLVDFDDEEEGEYRFLIDGKHVKYVTVDPGVLPKDDRTFAPIFLPLLPSFPVGDWNEGHVSKDPLTGEPTFSRCERKELAGISNGWHSTSIDHLEFTKVERLRQYMHVVTHANFDRPLLVKFTEFPWQVSYFEAETTAYEWIHGQGVGPEFLGHLAEGGRIIGFVLEYIEGARFAGPEDLAACQVALSKLHSLDIKHGDINKFNFLIRDGTATLIDFETAEKCSEREELEAEYDQLETALRDPSCRGGTGLATFSPPL